MRHRTAFVLLALLTTVAAISAAPAAEAATVAVSMQNYAFNPDSVKATQGSTVQWSQEQSLVQHTTTSDQGFWTSGFLSTGQTYSETTAFENAGIYAYHCEVHSFMTAKVKVPLTATGSATTGWTVRWSSLTKTPANRSFDVQIKRPGSTTWTAFRSGVTVRSAFFNPTKAGDYQLRARTNNLDNAMTSAWSPALTVTISHPE